MLFAVEIGNTNIVLAVMNQETPFTTWRITTKPYRTKDEYASLIRTFLSEKEIKLTDINESIISSVVPDLQRIFTDVIHSSFSHSPKVVGVGMKTGLQIKLDNPKEVGADLVVAAVAAVDTFPNEDVIIIDCGTATKLMYVTKNKEFLGGMIAPGLEIATKALSSETAALPQIALEFPKNPLGRGTIDAIASGVMYGYLGLLKELIVQLKSQYPDETPKIVATGGLMHKFEKHLDDIDFFDPDLLFKGLYILNNKNK